MSDEDNRPAADRLAEELQALVRDSEALLKATAAYADEKVQQARLRAEESVKAAKQRYAHVPDDVIGSAREFVARGETYLRDNPWASIGIAAAIGFLFGALMARRPPED